MSTKILLVVVSLVLRFLIGLSLARGNRAMQLADDKQLLIGLSLDTLKEARWYPERQRLPGDVLLARQEFKAMAAVLEGHMQGRRFVVGDRVTVADLVLAYTLDWATMEELLDGFPQLQAYLERMYARPSAPPRIAVALASVRRATS